MNCEEAALKIQALADGELDEKEITDVLEHIESCYRCREEYIQVLALQKKLKDARYSEPPVEWFEERYKKKGRKIGAFIGLAFFIASYIALIVYALVSMLQDPGVTLLLRLLIGGITGGVLVLFIVTLGDRIREKRTDRYGDVIK
ncbi:MAG: zf-HC2 domain-containing protein [Spirochaetales bacterium]|nr:zf-HC2 domain-containing protein [Spirochaetales bacterium]